MNFPKTAGQCKYVLALRSSKPIVIGTGPAGSGKTLLACHMAIEHIARGKFLKYYKSDFSKSAILFVISSIRSSACSISSSIS